MPEHLRAALRSIVTAAFLCSLAASATAQEITPEGDNQLVIQFDEVDGSPLDDWIKAGQVYTGLNLNFNSADTRDVRLKFIGKKRLARSEFWPYFQAVLKAYDFVVVPYGNTAPPGKPLEGPDTGFYAIRKSTGGSKPGYIKTQAPVVSAEELENYKYDPGIVLTTSFTLRFVNVQEAVNMLQSYFTDPMLESVRAIANSNSLVATGYAQTLYGMQRLLRLIDVQPSEYKPVFAKFELQYSVAGEIKPIVDQLIAAQRGEAAPNRGGVPGNPGGGLPSNLQEPEPHVEADDRTNALYVIAASNSMENIGAFIRQLDVDVDPRGDTHVYRLKNSAAKDLEEILNEWAQNSGTGGTSSGGSTTPGATSTASSGKSLEQPVSVVADEDSNSLVISASKSRYAQVLEVIKKLDVRRRQVLIESALVEISGDISESLGVELGYVSTDENPDSHDYGGFGVSSFGLSTLTDTDEDGIVDFRVPNGLEPGTSGVPGITAGIFSGKEFGVPLIINALQHDTNANVLSLPSALVNDNEEAVIRTVDERPTFTISQGVNSDQTNFNEYVEAGIQLNISPSISAGNYLRLAMKLEVSAFTEPTGNPPPRSRRELNTSVTLPDSHTMVIGGIISDDQRTSRDAIPWLGDLPLIGWLFANNNDRDTRTNLYVFITPHIISDDFATLDDLSYQKKKEMEALNGKIYLVDEDWDRDNADERVLDAGVSGVFDMPAYASPSAGEAGPTPKPQPVPDDAGYGETPSSAVPVQPAPQAAPPAPDSPVPPTTVKPAAK